MQWRRVAFFFDSVVFGDTEDDDMVAVAGDLMHYYPGSWKILMRANMKQQLCRWFNTACRAVFYVTVQGGMGFAETSMIRVAEFCWLILCPYVTQAVSVVLCCLLCRY